MRRWMAGALLAAGCGSEPAYAPEEYVDEQGLGFYTSFSGPLHGGRNLFLRSDGIAVGWDEVCSDVDLMWAARWERRGNEIAFTDGEGRRPFDALRLDPATRTATSLLVDEEGATHERSWSAGVTCGRGDCSWGDSGRAGYHDACAPEVPERVTARLGERLPR